MMNPDVWFSAPRLVCGLMSGTSLDGVDAAVCEFSSDADGKHSMRLLAFCTLPMPDTIRENLLRLAQGTNISTNDIALAHSGVALLFAEAVEAACTLANIPVSALSAVGSHGQTVWHAPKPQNFGEFSVGTTLQIGSPSTLSQKLGVPVVADFRSADVALGGEGAPLVPIFDYEFLRQTERDVIALNIGGIANITLIPADAKPDTVRAFDTGPGNMLIDAVVQKYYGKKYDHGGKIARDGRRVPRLWNTLIGEPFITQIPPKSTGRELFGKEYLESALEYNFYDWQPIEDAVRTFTEFTAWSIAENIRLFGNPASEVIASGGGVYNQTLMELLSQFLPEASITTCDEKGIPSDAKEAICFGYLAYRTLGSLPSNIPAVTGAKKAVPLGVISYPNADFLS